MATLQTLSAELKQLSLRISGDLDKVVRQVALAIDQAVVVATPVDTGQARSNWLVSVGQPRTDTIPAYDHGVLGSTSGPNTTQALDQGRGVISSAPSGATIYISNNLPYIGRLNQGYSMQAPAGYVERAVEAASNAVKAAYP